MFQNFFAWVLSASVHPFVFVSVMSISTIGFLMVCYNIRALSKHNRQQTLVNQQLHEEMSALSKSAIGMGQKVLETERRLAQVLKKQFSILNSQPEHPSYDQASHLIAMGATENDLVSSCGFSHSEAELLLSLNRKRQVKKDNAMH